MTSEGRKAQPGNMSAIELQVGRGGEAGGRADLLNMINTGQSLVGGGGLPITGGRPGGMQPETSDDTAGVSQWSTAFQMLLRSRSERRYNPHNSYRRLPG